MALQGDEPARQIFRIVGQSLGIALANVINIFNLPMYVIGGGVANAWDTFAPAMFETVRSYSYIYRVTAPPEGALNQPQSSGAKPEKHTIVTQAVLGSDAGLFGAARLPMITVPVHASV